MKILGIDYGDRKIGLALSDKDRKLASRFLTLENRSMKNTIRDIKEIIVKEEIEEIIIGIPIGLKTESEQTQKTRIFIDDLLKKINITVETMNEVFTSKMAEENLLNSGVKRENFREVIDQEAARIILQDHLDSKNKQ
ncbi:MAG: Holliday junction resolvase RuvX [Candidatus Pacebacteria bacterium]|nr:Holliday junction resolvase RuvX [Candidatus Paceibacterota bacterium]